MAESSQQSNPKSYKLYHCPFSSRSLQVRYTFLLRGEPDAESSRMELELVPVDLKNDEQLSEQFMCEVNPRGYVPVLVSIDPGSVPMPECVDISYFIAKRYPSLLPAAKELQIRNLMRELNEINFFSLSMAKGLEISKAQAAKLEAMAAEPGISQRYRAALEVKLQQHLSEKLHGSKPEVKEEMAERAQQWFQKIETLLDARPGGPWVFGDSPTLLDAHLVVFAARLRDVQRQNLIPEKVGRLVDAAMAGKVWQDMMEGGTTMVAPKGYFERSATARKG